MLKFDQVGKTYSDGYQAVKDLNFEIHAGEFIVLIGPSGCGKTTTMKMINRLERHTEGVITLQGKNINQIDPVRLRRNIGYVIQQTGLFPHYTIEQNISLLPDLKGWEPAKIKRRVEELMVMVGLEPSQYATRYPKELSGGQQQRVGVARALAADPDIILMDEPFGALDPLTREQIQDELLRLQQEMKKTIVFVTHDMDEALKLGDRIAVMKSGSLLQFDTPEMLLREPAHGFVEEFIGKKRIFQNPEFIPVTEIMRENPATISPSRSLVKAITIMRQRKTDTLLVSNDQGKLVGIISAYEVQTRLKDELTVESIVHPVHPILPNTATAKDALMAITEAKHGVIPVVDQYQRVIGVVTRGTLLTVFASHWAGEGDEEA
ncbi:proline/glycine betaine ABC transporter ATP-binding protein [Paenibacillus sp. CAA11]|uniref:ABC transporter ATP-binding protein n=1 Tax=Paenibacillus sp. CAA11 TaxID=1532905 RepID=UPI000D3BE8FA|nr:ABC transporter ATP-binding protein [Paenibacillus sp. CAA11]AWB44450.1 proline/glycine betaine ABC transporter ATP-binding protein [Paenibacillus sp. CAA11]